MVHTVTNLFVDCSFPKGFNWAVAIYACSLIALFANFYRHAYPTCERKKAAASGHQINGTVHHNGVVECSDSKAHHID